MKTQVQKAAWVAVAILLAGLSVTAIWQAQAISRLQNGTTTSKTFESVPYWPSDRDRIAKLERQAEADRWAADRQRRQDKAARELEEFQRWDRERQRERGW